MCFQEKFVNDSQASGCIVRLHDVGGMGPLVGIDEQSRYWMEFWSNGSGPDGSTAQCGVCKSTVRNGWMCVRTGRVLCNEHIVY